MGRSRNKLTTGVCWAVIAALCLTLIACAPSEPDTATAESDVAAATLAPVALGATLSRVKARRRLKCAVSEDKPGFAQRGLGGQWRGFDVDICRAVAAAVLGDARAVAFTATTSRTRFAALQSGAVDVVSGGGAWTFSHDEALGMSFAGISYYDGQSFLARKAGRLHTIADLAGSRICVLGGAASQQALADVFKARGEPYQPVLKDTLAQAVAAYRRGDCDALSEDASVLAGVLGQMPHRGDQTILPGSIAEEPLGLIVREDDPHWADVVRWTLNALILGEALAITAQNADDLRRHSDNPAIRRLLGVDGEYGRRLGLSEDWSYRALRQVGDYGEIFQRNLADLGLERGRNALWNAPRPGQIYAPPMR
ncbi:MAG TPA: amino acid ABC transporter substrate-binding protein [Caulobacteraceae bacterium]|nr:amino acid ABC transporter substrate-binding protein [Caulobacteraceae bacterium]